MSSFIELLNEMDRLGLKDSQTSGSADASQVDEDGDGGSDWEFPELECPYPGCGRTFARKAQLGNHKRTIHWMYRECLICVRGKKDQKLYRLDRVIDVDAHFSKYHPNISREQRHLAPSRYIQERYAKDDAQMVKLEEDGGKSSQRQACWSVGPSSSQSQSSETNGQGQGGASDKELTRVKEEKEQLQRRVTFLELDVQSLEDDKRILDEKLTKKREANADILHERDQLRERVFNSESKSLQLEREVSLLKDVVRLKDKAEQEAKEKCKDIEMTLSQAVDRVDAQEYEIRNKNVQISKLELANVTLRSEVTDLKLKHDAAVQRCVRRDAENARLRRNGHPKKRNNFKKNQNGNRKNSNRPQNQCNQNVYWSIPDNYDEGSEDYGPFPDSNLVD